MLQEFEDMCLDNPSVWSRFIVEEQLSSAFVNKRSIFPPPTTPPHHPPMLALHPPTPLLLQSKTKKIYSHTRQLQKRIYPTNETTLS